MLVCNPQAGLVLSTGAGSEIQFTMAGLHPDDGDCTYHRVPDLYDIEVFFFRKIFIYIYFFFSILLMCFIIQQLNQKKRVFVMVKF